MFPTNINWIICTCFPVNPWHTTRVPLLMSRFRIVLGIGQKQKTNKMPFPAAKLRACGDLELATNEHSHFYYIFFSQEMHQIFPVSPSYHSRLRAHANFIARTASTPWKTWDSSKSFHARLGWFPSILVCPILLVFYPKTSGYPSHQLLSFREI